MNYFTFNATVTCTLVVQAEDREAAQTQAYTALDTLYPESGVEQFDCGVELLELLQVEAQEARKAKRARLNQNLNRDNG